MKTEKNACVYFLMDRSGSMAYCLSDSQDGYDTFIKEQQNAKSERLISLWTFDNQYEKVYGLKPANSIPVRPESKAFRLIPRGSTALLDAVGKLIAYADIKSKRYEDYQTIVVILTDGYENSSVEQTSANIRQLIEARTELGWVFIYLGANQDAITVARSYGISGDTSISYTTGQTVNTVSGTSAMMSRGLSGGAGGQSVGSFAYDENERKSFVSSE